MEGIPVYTVEPVSGKGRSRVLHRNLLLPVCLPLEDGSVEQLEDVSVQKTSEQVDMSIEDDSISQASTEGPEIGVFDDEEGRNQHTRAEEQESDSSLEAELDSSADLDSNVEGGKVEETGSDSLERKPRKLPPTPIARPSRRRQLPQKYQDVNFINFQHTVNTNSSSSWLRQRCRIILEMVAEFPEQTLHLQELLERLILT
jgi:hypothetical protein